MRRQQPQDGRCTSCRGGIRWQREPLIGLFCRGNCGINAGSADGQALTAYGLGCKRAQTRQLLVAQAARLIERGNER